MNSDRKEEIERTLMRRDILLAIVIAAVAFLIFANSLGGDFVYDDNRQLLRNPLIQDPGLFSQALVSDVWAFKGDGSIAASNYWRPTFTAWSIINYQAFGREPFGWHLANLILHALVCLLAFAHLRRLRLSRAVSFSASLVFALHPVHSESVAWISGSPDLLFGFFLLASLWFARNYAASRQRVDLALAIILYAFSLGAKEVALLCLPIYWLIFRHDTGGKTERTARPYSQSAYSTLPFALAGALYFFMRIAVLGSIFRPAENATYSLSAVLSVPAVLLFYIKQILIPRSLSVNYALRPVEMVTAYDFWLPLLVSTVLIALIVFYARKHFAAALGAHLFFLPLLPAFYISAFPSDQIVHDRYLYLPLLGFLIIAFAFFEEIAERFSPVRSGTIVLLIATGVSVPLAVQTFYYNRVWGTELRLWERAVAVDSGSASNFAQYGSVLENEKRYGEAVLAFNRSLDISPGALAYLGRGRSNLFLGNHEEAVWDLNTVAEFQPEAVNAYTLYQAYEALAIAYTSRERFGDAREVLAAAIERLPIYRASLSSKLATVLYREGKKDEALRVLEAVQDQARRELLPESKSAVYRLGVLYAELGRNQEARTKLTEYLKITSTLTDENTRIDRRTATDILKTLERPTS